MDTVNIICLVKGIGVVVAKVNLMVLIPITDLIGADKLRAAVVVLDNQDKHGLLIPIHLAPVIQEQDLVGVEMENQCQNLLGIIGVLI